LPRKTKPGEELLQGKQKKPFQGRGIKDSQKNEERRKLEKKNCTPPRAEKTSLGKTIRGVSGSVPSKTFTQFQATGEPLLRGGVKKEKKKKRRRRTLGNVPLQGRKPTNLQPDRAHWRDEPYILSGQQ